MIWAVATALAGEGASYEPGEGWVIEADKSKAELRIRVWAQPIVGVEVDEDGAAGTLDVRRARMDFTMIPKDWLRLDVGLGADRGQVRLRNAEARVKLDDAFVLRFGRGRMPAGLERETSSRQLAFVERSAVADLSLGRTERIGFDGAAGPFMWRFAIGRVDPDELPADAPMAVDVAARFGASGDHAGVSVRAVASPRPMGAIGVRLTDPSDHTGLAAERAWTGVGVGGGLDGGATAGRVRVTVEGAMLREGLDADASLHAAGYALLGVRLGEEGARTGYGDGFALTKGWEALARAEAAITSTPGATSTGLGGSLALSYAPAKALRAQLELRGGASRVAGGAITPGGAAMFWLAVGP